MTAVAKHPLDNAINGGKTSAHQEGGKASTNRENHDSKVSVNTDKQLRQSIRYRWASVKFKSTSRPLEIKMNDQGDLKMT